MGEKTTAGRVLFCELHAEIMVILKRAEISVFRTLNLNARFGIGIDVSRNLKRHRYILKRAEISVFRSPNLNARFGIGIDVSRNLKRHRYTFGGRVAPKATFPATSPGSLVVYGLMAPFGFS